MKRIKKVIVLVLCLSFVFGSISVYAAEKGSQPEIGTMARKTKTASCPACRHSVTSYGVDEIYSTQGHYVTAGNRCPGCNQIVTSGTKHWYYTNIELYYFTCNDACCRKKDLQRRTFTRQFEDTTPRGHEVITLK